MKRIFKKKLKVNVVDIILISIFIFVAISLISRPSSSVGISFNTLPSPETVNEILITEYNKTPLSPEFNSSKISSKFISFKYSLLDFMSRNKFTGYFLNYFNESGFEVSDCSNCPFTRSSCYDSEVLMYYYPVDISMTELHAKINYDQELLIIDVRNEDDYIKEHIPSSVNIPLLDIVNFMVPVDRWSEIVIVGDNYIQTKLASEALQRLNFHRVHRLNVPVSRWDGEFESFIYEN